jgi:hypothetical protein
MKYKQADSEWTNSCRMKGTDDEPKVVPSKPRKGQQKAKAAVLNHEHRNNLVESESEDNDDRYVL